jgi:RNA-dependent RNA polymerase
VRITRSQWAEIPDLGKKPHEFTDGVGTISQQLGDLIWEALCAARHDHGKRDVKPSAVSVLNVVALSSY